MHIFLIICALAVATVARPPDRSGYSYGVSQTPDHILYDNAFIPGDYDNEHLIIPDSFITSLPAFAVAPHTTHYDRHSSTALSTSKLKSKSRRPAGGRPAFGSATSLSEISSASLRFQAAAAAAAAAASASAAESDQDDSVEESQEESTSDEDRTITHKHFYFVSAPEDNSSIRQTKHLVIGRPQKNYRVIFIKAPSSHKTNVHLTAEYPPQEEKTAIYVLSQKDQELRVDDIRTPEPTQPSKPEIFFVKYKTPQEAEFAQQQIQAQYDRLGGTSDVFDQGISPVSSVIGILRNGKSKSRNKTGSGRRRNGSSDLRSRGSNRRGSIRRGSNNNLRNRFASSSGSRSATNIERIGSLGSVRSVNSDDSNSSPEDDGSPVEGSDDESESDDIEDNSGAIGLSNQTGGIESENENDNEDSSGAIALSNQSPLETENDDNEDNSRVIALSSKTGGINAAGQNANEKRKYLPPKAGRKSARKY